MLAIEVAFLTGRYVATAYNSRSESEWPPHPARLFSALVSTHFAAPLDTQLENDAERSCLEWLEQQGGPAIVASEATSRDVFTAFVPVNDVAMTDVDAEAERRDTATTSLAAAEASGDAKKIKQATVAVRKAEAALKKAIARATAIPTKPVNSKYGQRLLPEHRVRQPRTFPSMTPTDPLVTYVWAEASPTREQRTALAGLLRRVVRLGHSSSLVSLRLADDPGIPSWHPAIDGDVILRVVQPGQLAALERSFEHHREVEPRVMPAVPQPYARKTAEETAGYSRPVFSDDWLVMRRVGGSTLPITAAAGFARAIRKALMSYAEEPIPEVLSGHTSDGRPASRPHVAIVPLPFVGHPHASGSILGVALVLPRATAGNERRAVYRAVAAWEQKFRQEDEDTPAFAVHLGAAGDLFLERMEWAAAQTTLKARTWCGPATIWSSVTPLALDRNPGDLRSRDSYKLAAAVDEAAETIRLACERIGLPRPRSVEVLPAAPWAGAAKVRQYPPFPRDTGRTQRVLTHARIRFEHPVIGPVLLGGRFAGLGLFRPEAPR